MSDFIYNQTGYKLDVDDIVVTSNSYERYFNKFNSDYIALLNQQFNFVEVKHDQDNKQFVLVYELENYECEDCDYAYHKYGREYWMDVDHGDHEEQGIREEVLTYKLIDVFI